MSHYLQYLIWLMLFVIVIEMVFPDLAYRKYIKLVLGCILVYTMLSPIVRFIRVDGADYKTYVEHYQQILEGDGGRHSDYSWQYSIQQENLESLYEMSMKQDLEKQMELKVQDIRVTMQDGVIQNVMLVVGKKEEAIQIGEIHIGDKSATVDGTEEKLTNKIKTYLRDFYNVQVGNIYITVQKN